MGSPAVSPPIVKAKALFCPNCGGPVELRGFAHTLSVVCPQCLSVLDATTPTFAILQTFQSKERIQPKIPLGARGKLEGVAWECIGFQVRTAGAQGEAFSWEEYLLFNPYQGFRYLSEYEGHWNFIRPLTTVLEPASGITIGKVVMAGRPYRLFSRANAVTTYVVGEFPWRVEVGETVSVDDYIAPPFLLSAETTEGEVTWSRGEYWTGQQIWQAFQLKGSPPGAAGIFANQPSPVTGKVRSAWFTWLWLMVALAALAFAFLVISPSRSVFHDDYVFTPGTAGEASFVTPVFDLTGRGSNAQVRIKTDLSNNWAYFNLALINEQTGQGFDVGREVSYYGSGSDSEGSRKDSVIIPNVPAGRYYLRVEPEGDRGADPVHYSIEVRRGVPNFTFFYLAAGFLLIPPILMSMRARRFEAARWRESDFAPATYKSGSGDSD
jgi:hypothetical protein